MKLRSSVVFRSCLGNVTYVTSVPIEDFSEFLPIIYVKSQLYMYIFVQMIKSK